MVVQIEETEQSKVAVPNTFAIYAGGRCILVAAVLLESDEPPVPDLVYLERLPLP